MFAICVSYHNLEVRIRRDPSLGFAIQYCTVVSLLRLSDYVTVRESGINNRALDMEVGREEGLAGKGC